MTTLRKKVVITMMGNTRAFDDLVLPLHFSLRRLGYDSHILRNGFHRDATNILVGLCDFPDLELSELPEDCIIYNMEQLVEGSKGIVPGYLNACARLPVWDYSRRNVELFEHVHGISGVRHVPLGYCPEMTRIDPEYPKDIDVLLYGALNERRRAMIRMLCDAGVGAMGFSGVYGLDRDILIARSRLVMNIHFYIPGIQEIIRLGYLWANSKCVVCECNTDTNVHFGYEDCCIYAPYEQMVERIRLLLRNPQSIRAMGRAAFMQFSRHAFVDILDAEVGPAPGGGTPQRHAPVPDLLNAGSGKNFLPEALNVDINPQWNPDIVMDISRPLDYGCAHATQRFGPVTLRRGMFRRIRLFDVLEHIPDVTAAMTNLLELLHEGGELHINVPYDLSLGAWQDPTHLHAFNENSWLYYTEWHWYVGWREARFDMVDISYTLSELGQRLERQGRDRAAILRQPRAVDAMEVRLRKRATNFEEKTAFDRQTRAVFLSPQRDWLASAFETK